MLGKIRMNTMSELVNIIELPLKEFIKEKNKLCKNELKKLGCKRGTEHHKYIELMWASQWYEHQNKNVKKLRKLILNIEESSKQDGLGAQKDYTAGLKNLFHWANRNEFLW